MTEQISYPKGDLRRMLLVLGAIDSTPDATLTKIVSRSGLDKKTVVSLIERAGVEASVTVVKTGFIYQITEWGPVIKQRGAKLALNGALNAPTISPTPIRNP